MVDALSNSWLVPLRGHDFDLEDLPTYLRGAEVKVVKRDAAYFLVLPFKEFGAKPGPIRDSAVEVIARLNGAMTLLVDSHGSVEIADAPYIALNGCGEATLIAARIGTAYERNKACPLSGSVGGVVLPDPRSGTAVPLLATATEKPAFADALALIGRPSPSWSELYLIYELVEAHVGKKMIDHGWISSADATRFRRTVNSYTALGRLGRHGKDSGDPPAIAMSYRKARALIRGLVLGWASDLASDPKSDAQLSIRSDPIEPGSFGL